MSWEGVKPDDLKDVVPVKVKVSPKRRRARIVSTKEIREAIKELERANGEDSDGDANAR